MLSALLGVSGSSSCGSPFRSKSRGSPVFPGETREQHAPVESTAGWQYAELSTSKAAGKEGLARCRVRGRCKVHAAALRGAAGGEGQPSRSKSAAARQAFYRPTTSHDSMMRRKASRALQVRSEDYNSERRLQCSAKITILCERHPRNMQVKYMACCPLRLLRHPKTLS